MKFVLKLIKWCLLGFFVSSIFMVLVYRFLPVPFTPLMLIRSVQMFNANEEVVLEHKWVPLQKISRYMPVAVIASEDQNFMHHKGFDVNAIQTAVEEKISGKRMRGASTISQQTAKNLFLWPTSSWTRKGFEAYFTVLIELLWPKERIVEVYLNSIEMGKGIYGVEAVAREHFGCAAKDLKRSDCALIAATLPNPLKWSSATPNAYMRQRQRWIEKQMRHIPLVQKN